MTSASFAVARHTARRRAWLALLVMALSVLCGQAVTPAARPNPAVAASTVTALSPAPSIPATQAPAGRGTIAAAVTLATDAGCADFADRAASPFHPDQTGEPLAAWRPLVTDGARPALMNPPGHDRTTRVEIILRT